MTPNGIVALLTDFGLQDVFVGAMKGVILNVAPHLRIVDVTHGVPAHDVRVGSLFLASAARFFPAGTVFVAVVDPGVGSERRAVAVRTGRAWYVAPDNGLLTAALRRETMLDAVEVTNPDILRSEISDTFHGRDVFAPAGAHLANGTPVERLGPACRDLVRLTDEQPLREGHVIRASVVFADCFGNLITNLHRDEVAGKVASVELDGLVDGSVGPVRRSYSAVPEGARLAVWNSFDLLEVAINGGNLARQIGWTPERRQGVTVRLR